MKGRQSMQNFKSQDNDSYFKKSMGKDGKGALIVSLGGADSLHSLMDGFGDK